MALTQEQKDIFKEKVRSGEIEVGSSEFNKVLRADLIDRPLGFAAYAFKHHMVDRATGEVSETPDFHQEVIEIYLNNLRVALAAPRGHAKSTLTDLFYVCHQVVFGHKKFVVIISETETLAMKFLSEIRTELETNENIHSLMDVDTYATEKWSEKELVLSNGACIIAKGRGGQMRGLKHRGQRPDLVICDDLENEELVRSQQRRLDVEAWFNGAVLPSLEPSIGQLIFIGTILHEDSLLARLLNPELYPDFTTKKFQAMNPDTLEPLWPERFSQEKLLSIKEAMIQRQQLPRFYMEYMNDPMPEEAAAFKSEYFQYHDKVPDEVAIQTSDNNTKFVASDPISELYVDLGGGSSKASADPTAIVALKITRDNNIYVDDYINDRMGTDVDRIIDALFDMHKRHEPSRVYIEKTMATNLLMPSLLARMKRDNVHMNVELISPTRGSGAAEDRRGNMSDGKFQRIASMEAPFKLGVIKIRSWMTDLKDQLLTFPRGRHDDIIDALAYGYQQLPRRANRYITEHSGVDEYQPLYPELGV